MSDAQFIGKLLLETERLMINIEFNPFDFITADGLPRFEEKIESIILKNCQGTEEEKHEILALKCVSLSFELGEFSTAESLHV